MKRLMPLLLCAAMTAGCAVAEKPETSIVLSEMISVSGAAITQDPSADVYLDRVCETHADVPEALKAIENRVVTITEAGDYRISGDAEDTQILVRAGEDDRVRLILDGVNISCRTAPAIAIESGYDARVAGEYGIVIELADGSENRVAGSHTVAPEDDEAALEYDGAIGSQISLGFEGGGSLTIDADNEGVEVAFGHLTINGGTFSISASDDPLNVAEDGVGTLTINDGYVFSSVKPDEGGEGDGVDSNGSIVFNGGTVINLAHPGSMDSGIDADMGSAINGGVIVGAGNMYDPIDEASAQLFMVLEFAEETDQLVVVTDENDQPVFAYDFPYDYMYIAFSTPDLAEGDYRVYLGGEIEGTEQNGLYTDIVSYTPGTRMQHGEGTAQQRMGGMQPMPGGEMPDMPGGMSGQMGKAMQSVTAYQQALESVDLNELLRDVDLNELLKGLDLNLLFNAYSVQDLLSSEQIAEHFDGVDLNAVGQSAGGFGQSRGGMGRGMGGPRGMESSADTATDRFSLARGKTGFTNVRTAEGR